MAKPHVLVCIQGKWPTNLFCFVAHLRVPTLPNPPIVILHPHKPTIADWGCVGMFNEVYHVQGSPLCEIDLVRAGVLQAGLLPYFTSDDVCMYSNSLFSFSSSQ
jgi:potassium large conductance calcium-activated channel subfamily M alpha protein 1